MLPGALLASVREQGTGLKALEHLPSAGAPVAGLRTGLPPQLACSSSVALEGQQGPPTCSPSHHQPQPLLHIRGISEGGSSSPPPSARGRISLNPGHPALKLNCLSQGPPLRRVLGSPEGCPSTSQPQRPSSFHEEKTSPKPLKMFTVSAGPLLVNTTTTRALSSLAWPGCCHLSFWEFRHCFPWIFSLLISPFVLEGNWVFGRWGVGRAKGVYYMIIFFRKRF